VAGKADRQVAGVQRGGLLRGIDQKAEAGEVVGRGEFVPAERQLQRTEPVVFQPLNLGALRRVVVGLPVRLAPLIELVKPSRRLIVRQVRIGHEIQTNSGRKHGQQHQPKQGASQQSHRYFLVASWRKRVYGRFDG